MEKEENLTENLKVIWLGRWFVVQTPGDEDDDLEQDIREIRELLKESNDGGDV